MKCQRRWRKKSRSVKLCKFHFKNCKCSIFWIHFRKQVLIILFDLTRSSTKITEELKAQCTTSESQFCYLDHIFYNCKSHLFYQQLSNKETGILAHNKHVIVGSSIVQKIETWDFTAFNSMSKLLFWYEVHTFCNQKNVLSAFFLCKGQAV